MVCLCRYDFNTHQKSFKAIELISNEIGPFFQTHNEYLDCFDDQSRLNKPGHDIQDGQFTWFATMAMELGTEQQRDIMRRNYGKHGKISKSNRISGCFSFSLQFHGSNSLADADCVAKVKQLYLELCLLELYKEYRERNQNNVMYKVDQLLHTDETLRNAFINLLNQVYDH